MTTVTADLLEGVDTRLFRFKEMCQLRQFNDEFKVLVEELYEYYDDPHSVISFVFIFAFDVVCAQGNWTAVQWLLDITCRLIAEKPWQTNASVTHRKGRCTTAFRSGLYAICYSGNGECLRMFLADTSKNAIFGEQVLTDEVLKVCCIWGLDSDNPVAILEVILPLLSEDVRHHVCDIIHQDVCAYPFSEKWASIGNMLKQICPDLKHNNQNL
jgi:hypothetical protein